MKPKTLVLGLGNSLLSDDAVGLLVVEELERCAPPLPNVFFERAQVAGFKLVDLLVGYDKAIIVDAIISDRAPAGQAYWLELAELRRPLRDRSNHNIHLADALELGSGLGLEMPREVKVLAIEVEDSFTLSEEVGELARESIPLAVRMLLEELEAKPKHSESK